MKRIDITDALKKEIIEFYLAHNTRATLKQFKIRLDNLNWILDSAQIPHYSNKTNLTDSNIAQLLLDYKTHPDKAIFTKYHITKARLQKILMQNDQVLHSNSENIQLAKYQEIKLVVPKIIEYYTEHNKISTIREFKINEWLFTFILNINGIPLHTEQEIAALKGKATSEALQAYHKTHKAIGRPSKHKKQLTEAELAALIEYQKTHSNAATQKYFKLTYTRYNEILNELGIEKASNHDSRSKGVRAILSKEEQQSLIEYYADHSDLNTYKKFKISKQHMLDILATYGIQQHSKEENRQFGSQVQKETLIERYGVDNCQKVAECREKVKRTCLEKYGVPSYTQTKEYQEKSRQTCLKKYGTSTYGSSTEAQAYRIATCQKWRKKISKTMAKNNTFNSSRSEEAFYEELCQKFKLSDVIRQYTEVRYPFACDFYIKSQDLFIELNLTWTHGGHLFNSNELADRNKLQIWQEKAKVSEYYKNAIYTWTDLDIRKHQVAAQNKLNFIVFYNLQEAIDWLNNI